MKEARYLEIGTWKGSSICSAMCNNKMTCVAIDNRSEFGGTKKEFLFQYYDIDLTHDKKFHYFFQVLTELSASIQLNMILLKLLFSDLFKSRS